MVSVYSNAHSELQTDGSASHGAYTCYALQVSYLNQPDAVPIACFARKPDKPVF